MYGAIIINICGGYSMKKIFILISLLMMIPLMSCTDDKWNTQIIKTWSKNYPQVGDYYVIDSYDELSKHIYDYKLSLKELDEAFYFFTDMEFNSLNIDKYDEDFFENNSLVFVVHHVWSISGTYEVKKINISDGLLKIKFKLRHPTDVDDALANWTVVIEMSKEDVNSIIDTQIILNNKIVK
jgi:hypothetical protein